MIVSHQLKMAFIHIPKTGGSAFTKNFMQYIDPPLPLDKSTVQEIDGWQGLFHHGGQHSGYLENKTRLGLISDYKTVAFCRNPWDWMLSWYVSMNWEDNNLSPEGFKQFVFNPPETHASLINRSQFTYLCDEDGVVKIDLIFRYERYQKEVEFICKEFGIPNVSNQKVNSHNDGRLNYRDFFDSETLIFFNEKYQYDVNFLGYKYE